MQIQGSNNDAAPRTTRVCVVHNTERNVCDRYSSSTTTLQYYSTLGIYCTFTIRIPLIVVTSYSQRSSFVRLVNRALCCLKIVPTIRSTYQRGIPTRWCDAFPPKTLVLRGWEHTVPLLVALRPRPPLPSLYIYRVNAPPGPPHGIVFPAPPCQKSHPQRGWRGW